jgi:hypothetical protein
MAEWGDIVAHFNSERGFNLWPGVTVMRDWIDSCEDIEIRRKNSEKLKYVAIPDNVCAIAEICAHLEEWTGYGFNITDEMKNKLQTEAGERGRVSESQRKNQVMLFIPADEAVKDDTDANLSFVNAKKGWDVKDIVAEGIPQKNEKSKRSILFNNNSKGTIYFVPQESKGV